MLDTKLQFANLATNYVHLLSLKVKKDKNYFSSVSSLMMVKVKKKKKSRDVF